jgi:hypothetical protein
MQSINSTNSRIMRELNKRKETVLISICEQLNEDWDERFMSRITRVLVDGQPDAEDYWLDFNDPGEKHLATFTIKYPGNNLESTQCNVVMEIESKFDF